MKRLPAAATAAPATAAPATATATTTASATITATGMAVLRLRVLGLAVLGLAVLGLATLGPAAHAAGDPAAGKQKATACIACHGEKGEGRSGNPRIANLGEEKIIAALKAFQDGSRPSQTMQRFARGSHQDFADIAAYFASRN